MNILLITGGCGFIGTALIKNILKSSTNIQIRVLDSLLTGTLEDLGAVCEFTVLQKNEPLPKDAGIYFLHGDICDAEIAMYIGQNVHSIVHLAANTGVGPSVENPVLDMQSNVIGTVNMLESARKNGIKSFIFASSGAPAGAVTPPIHEELPPHPVSPYGASKLAGEGYCSAYFQTFGINTVCLRFGNVYGPGSLHKSSIVAKFIRQAVNGEICEIYGDGTQTRDFIYIDDLINAIMLGIEKEVGGETFQIASSSEKTIDEIAQILAEELKKHGIDMKIKYGEKRLGDVMRNFSDTSKAKNMLGWQTQMDLKEGIAITVAYFIE